MKAESFLKWVVISSVNHSRKWSALGQSLGTNPSVMFLWISLLGQDLCCLLEVKERGPLEPGGGSGVWQKEPPCWQVSSYQFIPKFSVLTPQGLIGSQNKTTPSFLYPATAEIFGMPISSIRGGLWNPVSDEIEQEKFGGRKMHQRQCGQRRSLNWIGISQVRTSGLIRCTEWGKYSNWG